MSLKDEKAGAAGENLLGSASIAPEQTGAEDFSDDGIKLEEAQNLQAFVESIIGPIGLEVHPFLVGWYNEKVGPRFQLDYPNDTLAFVIISGPDTFEKCIIPYVKSRLIEDPSFITHEPLDDSMKHAFTILKDDLKGEGVESEVFHDFDLHPSRRPKILVQTAAHVAGAVQYLHKCNLSEEVQIQKFSKKSNLSGVAIHPRYGGWYAIRGVIIFTNVPAGKDLTRPDPLQIFNNEDVIARAIELFAYDWQTNEWRDIHPGIGCKYSTNFMKYLEMETTQRWDFIKNILIEEETQGDHPHKEHSTNRSPLAETDSSR